MAMKYAKKRKLKMTAGSDAHLLREIGKCACYIDACDIDEILHAIKKGKVYLPNVKVNSFEVIYNTLATKILRVFKKRQNKI